MGPVGLGNFENSTVDGISGTTGSVTGPALGAGRAGFDSPVPDCFLCFWFLGRRSSWKARRVLSAKIRGSSPLRPVRGCSAVGSAPPCQSGGRRFEPGHPLLVTSSSGRRIRWTCTGPQRRPRPAPPGQPPARRADAASARSPRSTRREPDRLIGVYPMPTRRAAGPVRRHDAGATARGPAGPGPASWSVTAGRCGYCGGHASTIDHVLPRSRGGRNTWPNTVAACDGCNQRKGDRTPAEAGHDAAVPSRRPRRGRRSATVR